jgi:hypothetical protein
MLCPRLQAFEDCGATCSTSAPTLVMPTRERNAPHPRLRKRALRTRATARQSAREMTPSVRRARAQLVYPLIRPLASRASSGLNALRDPISLSLLSISNLSSHSSIGDAIPFVSLPLSGSARARPASTCQRLPRRSAAAAATARVRSRLLSSSSFSGFQIHVRSTPSSPHDASAACH